MKNILIIVTLFCFNANLFAQDLGSLCSGGEDASIFSCSGTLNDSGGAAADYSNDDFFRYTICNPDGGPISLTINYDTESGFDYLEIVDGHSIYDIGAAANATSTNI